MTTRHPQKLPLDRIYDMLPEEVRANKNIVCFRDGIGVTTSITSTVVRRLSLLQSPFLLEDYRMGLVVRGEMRGVINLREYTMCEGTIVFVTPGTIVEPRGVSDDFLMEGMGLTADKFLLAHNGKVPELFNGLMSDGRMVTDAANVALVNRMLCLSRDIMERDDMAMEVIYSMVTAVTRYFDQQFRDRTSAPAPSHSAELFNKFLRLVNLHGSREHRLAYYAGELCVTSRYLGTVVQTVSGVGAKEWIDRAVVSTAKVLLQHTDKQIAQIAYELNFPNASFFCKYFKRLTGVTPLQYRGK